MTNTQPRLGARTDLASIGARAIPEFDGVHEVWPRGRRLEAVREAAAAYKPRFKAQGQVTAVKSVDIAAAPYPVSFAFHGAVTAPHLPLISMINRMIVVQYDDFDGRPRTLVFEPTVPEGSAEAPFYANLVALTEKVPFSRRVTEALVLKYYNQPEDVLDQLGLTADDIDFCTFDHLHVQDPRMILGSTSVIPGESEPRRPLFGNARMLVHSRELATLESLHPMQWAWYVEDGLDGVDPDLFVRFDEDIELGPGVALLWRPVRLHGQGEDARRPEPPRPALAADPAVHRAGAVATVLAGDTHVRARRHQLWRDPLAVEAVT